MSDASDRLAKLIMDAMEPKTVRKMQVAPEYQHQFASLHQVGHFIRERLGENIADILAVTNLPTLLAGEVQEDSKQMVVTTDCYMEAQNQVMVRVGFDDGPPLMTFQVVFTPSV